MAIEPLGVDCDRLEHVGLLLHIGVMLVFLIFVLHSKHLHIFVAPINVMSGPRPVALGAAKELIVAGKPFSMEQIEELDEDAALGVGKVEDFTWKGLLDFTTCTECGRCQSQCPAWNTDKPLSPKLLVMACATTRTPRRRTCRRWPRPTETASRCPRASRPCRRTTATPHRRPVLGRRAARRRHRLRLRLRSPPTTRTARTPSSTRTCCGRARPAAPASSSAPSTSSTSTPSSTCAATRCSSSRRSRRELGGLFKNLESKANPWGMAPRARLDWAKDLPFQVKVLGQDVEKPSDVDYLFWVGCAGAYEDRAKKTTRAVAELLDTAGVTFAVLGDGETCTGDSARRAGNEFLFQTLAAAERRDARRVRRHEDRRHLRALLQHDQERVPPARWALRGGPPHPAAQPAGARQEARAGGASERRPGMSSARTPPRPRPR